MCQKHQNVSNSNIYMNRYVHTSYLYDNTINKTLQKNLKEQPHAEHACDLQLEIHQLTQMMSHTMTAQNPMIRGKLLFETVIN